MQRVGVFYATKEGHARKVAERVGAALELRSLEVAVHDVKDAEAATALGLSDAVVLVGSVHLGKHEPELIAFVKEHRAKLALVPAAFLSVSGSEAGAEKGATAEVRAKSAAHVQEQLQAFTKETSWLPRHVRPVAGAFVFTHYNTLVRWAMKLVAKSEGLPADTSRDSGCVWRCSEMPRSGVRLMFSRQNHSIIGCTTFRA